MLMTEKGSLRKVGTNEDLDLCTTTGNSILPLHELLVNSTVPAAAVAVKLSEDSTDEAGRSNGDKRRGILSNFQRVDDETLSLRREAIGRCWVCERLQSSAEYGNKMKRMDGSTSKTLSPSSSGSGKVHLGDGMALSGLKRALSQVSMLVMKATTSGETAWREELQKDFTRNSSTYLPSILPTSNEKPTNTHSIYVSRSQSLNENFEIWGLRGGEHVDAFADTEDRIEIQTSTKSIAYDERQTGFSVKFLVLMGPVAFRYRQTRFSSRRIRKRVVFKHGDCNVVQGNVAKRRRRYLQDIFTTLVDAQWRWTLLVFSMNFLLSWLGFALIWWLIAYSHGDLDPDNYSNPNLTFTPCIMDIRGFTSSFLFSIETQHTIGYGSKHPTDECPEAVFVICIQSMTGVILQAFMVGIVFAKLSRPKKRTQTLLFSRNAVICQRDGQPCLMFRVGDMRKSHIIEAHVRAQMIKRKVTREGELLPFFQTELKVGGDGEEDKIFFIWPTTIVHKIDEMSPLYHISASDMLKERFEIVVMLEGVIESTGMTTQARSSYLPSEILWGHRFEHIITFKKETGEYEVNYTLFNNTYEVDTPLCSAADLDKIRSMQRAKGERMSTGVFPHYRDASSSSLTTGSGSSLASSTGGLHMNVPMTTLTPIPVMITGPDGSLRRESMQSMQTDGKQPIFYTQNELSDSEPHPISHTQEEQRNQEDYNRVLEDINATLRKNRGQSKEEKRMHRESSRGTLESKKNEGRSNVEVMRRSSSRTTMDQVPVLINPPPRSPSRQHLEPRPTKFAEHSEDHHESSPHPHSHPHPHPHPHSHAHPHPPSRRSSLGDNQKPHHPPPREPHKKTSFILGDDDHVITISKSPSRHDHDEMDSDSSKTNHHPPSRGPQEQV
ncbi:ATP-sensitive inward rectifier potassium channel 12 [Dufourea novaeangliae]|uniref:ATP-sensitive inward rectifier potassium channel 12 n=1 Tax=Dufourea novaeangliae TaxID=178035 RepID=A0A154P1L1_DUFNO|nr:ATP-sensitive inward rectifier potassium channel 12 [Dufourea novaeangliae]